MSDAPGKRVAYLFLDEGGNFDFSPTSTKYFTLSTLLMFRPFPLDDRLTTLRFDLLEAGNPLERFHASYDNWPTRNQVFTLMQDALHQFRVQSVIIEKRKVWPELRADHRFYPKMMGYLLRRVLTGIGAECDRVIVITDRIPLNRKRAAIEKALKTTLTSMLRRVGIPYEVHHHNGCSCCGLQLVDYANWAVYRAWESGDDGPLRSIRAAVEVQWEMFKNARESWY